MATYKGIQGFTIQNLSADPSNPIEGQVWYNSTSNVWKVEEATAAGAWATGGSLGTGRYTRMTGGTQNDAILAGGLVPAPAITEEYNGTSWSAGGAMNVIRRANAGCGVTTAAVNVGGTTLPNGTPPIGTKSNVEEYDGSTWTNVNAMPTALRSQYVAGIQTAAFAAGGFAQPPDASVSDTYEYDGTNWTVGGSLNQARSDGQACGTQTAGLAVGGRDTIDPYPAYNNVEHYDGTSWTAGGGYPVAMSALGVSGNQTAALGFGGYTGGVQSAANLYDGTSWTATTALNTARGYLSGCGTQTLALAVGGSSGNNATEEFTGAGAAVTKTITVS
jgi:hypothetical protein